MLRRWTVLLAGVVGASVLAAGCGLAGGAGTAAGGSARPAATRAATRPAVARPVIRLRYRYITDLSDGTTAARYGYDLVDVTPDRSVIDALPPGVRALVWIGNYSHSTCSFTMSDTQVRQALAPLAGDPKVAGYYVDDEADYALPADGGHCPNVVAQVTARSELVHQLAPGAFTYQTVSDYNNYAAFAHATDVLGAVAYPCKGDTPCDWSLIPGDIARLNAAHVTHYWAVLDAFGYEGWRLPTPAQLARMIGQWEHSRWQGEQTFAWNWQGSVLADHPGLLAALRDLNRGDSAALTSMAAARRPASPAAAPAGG